MRHIKIIILLSCLAVPFFVSGQNAKAETGTFALTNGTIVTVSGDTLTEATLIIQDGKIAAIGKQVSAPEGAKRLDCTGLFLFPGMIDSGTRLGLIEVGSDQRTRDYNEIGEVIPQMHALTAVNPNSALIPVTRISGVTTVLTAPAGGMFPGTAALINLHGYTPDQMYAGFEGVVIEFPVTGKRGWWDRRSDEEIKKEAEKNYKQLTETWQKAVSYSEIDSALTAEERHPEFYPEMEALKPFVRGEKPVLVEVNTAKDIYKAIEWVKENKVNAIFTGVAEGWRAATELAEANIPVIAGPVLSTPTRASDSYDRPYENAGLLLKSGVTVAIRTSEAENVRNLPYNAGFAAAYGMGKEAALRAITLTPAEIFGIDDRAGSLDEGKDATLFVTDGDPFETSTDVKYVFINGWNIPLESRQTKLYDEFLHRQPGLEK